MFNIQNVKKAKNEKEEKEISYERISVVPSDLQNIFVSNTKTSDLLSELNNTSNLVDAIELIIDNTPDGKMAKNIYLRLANQGFNVTWKNATNNRTVKRYDAEFRSFCARMGKNNSAGIDGIIDQLHESSIARGGMAVEILVSKSANDIEDVVLVDPASIVEFQWLPDQNRYAAYQQQTSGKKVDLYEGNFFFVPHEPKVGRPDGTLQFAPAVTTMSQYLQLLQDSLTVLNRIGFPRYKTTINRQSLVESSVDKSEEGQRKLFERTFNEVRSNLARIGKNNDIISFDDIQTEPLGGGNSGGIDVRAWFEAIEPLVVNSFQLTPVLMGRLTSGSYSLGSVEFKIVTDTVDSMRRGSKRILEEIFKMWARVKGYNIYPVVNYNPIDWEKEIDKLDVQLKKMEYYRRAEEYKYIDKSTAAMESVGVEKPSSEQSDGFYEYVQRYFSLNENNENNTQGNGQLNNTIEGGDNS